ncbi:MAG: AsmA family protein [Aestuariivirga sp.]
MKKRLVWIGVATSLGLFAAGIWAFVQPNFAINALQDYVARKTGRTLLVNGGGELEFYPRLGVRLHDVFLSNPKGMDGNFAHSSSVRLPLQFSDLLRRKIKIREISLTEPVFNVRINGEGRLNWTAEGQDDKGGQPLPGTDANRDKPLKFLVENGSVNFLDERNGQAFSLADAASSIVIGEDGELDAQGTVSLNKQIAYVDAHVTSIGRLGQDGSPLDLTVTAPALSVNFTGRMTTHGGLGLAGAIDSTSPDIHALSKWLGSEIGGTVGLKNFSLSGDLNSTGAVFNLAKANVALDGMVASGDVTLDLNQKTPNVRATLSTDMFTLDPYLEAQRDIPLGEDEGSQGWKTSKVTFSGLTGVNGSLTLSASQVRWNGAEIGQAEFSSTLKDGKLEAAVQNVSLYGGKATASIALDGAGETPVLRLDVDAQAIRGEEFFSAFAGVDWLAGTTGLRASLTAAGHNQREMMSTLSGNLKIDVSDGEITGLNIVDMVSKVSSAISEGWGKGPENLTSFDRAAATFAIEDGIARSADVKIESPAFEVSGRGEIDLRRRAIDFKFDPRLVTGANETAKLPVQMVVKGSWSSPRIYPDVEGILDSPDAAYDTLRALGMSGKMLKKIEKQGGKLLNNLFGN